jgi:hypothetical protein
LVFAYDEDGVIARYHKDLVSYIVDVDGKGAKSQESSTQTCEPGSSGSNGSGGRKKRSVLSVRRRQITTGRMTPRTLVEAVFPGVERVKLRYQDLALIALPLAHRRTYEATHGFSSYAFRTELSLQR